MCCLIVKGGRLISSGVNKEGAPKHFVKQYRENLALHAEVHSVLGLPKSVTKNATAYICGVTAKKLNKLLCKPCPSCLGCLIEMKVKRIVYHDQEGNLHEFVR